MNPKEQYFCFSKPQRTPGDLRKEFEWFKKRGIGTAITETRDSRGTRQYLLWREGIEARDQSSRREVIEYGDEVRKYDPRKVFPIRKEID